ncbi:MAG: hypothetical protein ACPGPE_01375, partial [Planctomycetota bacterium]
MSSSVHQDAHRDRGVGLRTRLHYSMYASELGFRVLKGHRRLTHWGARRQRTLLGRTLIKRT